MLFFTTHTEAAALRVTTSGLMSRSHAIFRSLMPAVCAEAKEESGHEGRPIMAINYAEDRPHLSVVARTSFSEAQAATVT